MKTARMAVWLLVTALAVLPGQPVARADEEDAAWLARLPVMQLGKQPAHVPAGKISADPNVRKIFPKPTVFKHVNLYLWFSSQTYTVPERPDLGELRSSTKWYFLPTGRVFVKNVNYGPNAPPQGVIKLYWGRYTVGPDDAIRVETDAGEKIDVQLANGRRNLIWGDTTYGQVDWENEALRRQLGQ